MCYDELLNSRLHFEEVVFLLLSVEAELTFQHIINDLEVFFVGIDDAATY